MNKITTGNKTLQPDNVYKIAKGQEAEAMKAAEKSAADDVLFKMGGDTFAASGRGMDLKGVKPGDEVEYQGKPGTVLQVDNKLNAAKDVLKKPFSTSTKVAGVGAAIAIPSAAGFLLSLSPAIGAYVPGALSLAPAIWAGAAVLGGVVLLGGAAGMLASSVFGASRKVDTEELKKFAEAPAKQE